MRAGPALLRATAIAVFLQLMLGGLLTFDFISAAPHIVLGSVVFGLAVASAIVVWASKPAFRPLRGMSAALVALLTLQIVLGFYALDSDNAFVAWLHFVNSLAIYGISVSGAFMAMRWEKMSREPAGPAQAK